MKITRLVFTPAILGCFLILASCNNGRHEFERPNILFILTDDQHRDQYNFLPEGRKEDGQPKNLCPTIDRLASEGVILEGLHCPSPLCVPSRFNYLTGLYASRATNRWFTDLHKLHGHTFVAQEPKLTEDTPTLARQLKALGYLTGFVGKNHSVEVDGWHKLPVDADVTTPASREHLARNHELVKEALHGIGFDFADRLYHTNPMAHGPKAISVHNLEWITEGALEFIDRCGSEPFYLVYSTTVPHGPRNGWTANPRATPAGILETAPDVGTDRSTIPGRLEAAGLDRSRGDMLWLDDNIRILVEKLETRGLLDRTVIVYVSDHGVENGKTTAYEGGMRTVGFFRGKGIRKGAVDSSLTSTVDLVPTLMEIAGGDPGIYDYDGVSLFPILNGEKQQVRESVYGEMGHSRVVVKGKYKYLALRYSEYSKNMPLSERNAWLEASTRYMTAIGRTPFIENDVNGPFGHSGHIPDGWDNEWGAMKRYPAYFDADQLYDLEADPGEQHNLASDPAYRDVLKDLKAELAGYIRVLPGGFGEFKEDPYALYPPDSAYAIAARLREDIFH